MSLSEIENLITQARPVSDEDWGSERQINLENKVWAHLDTILSEKQRDAFSNYCSKATTDEALDAALRVVRGEMEWLDRWTN